MGFDIGVISNDLFRFGASPEQIFEASKSCCSNIVAAGSVVSSNAMHSFIAAGPDSAGTCSDSPQSREGGAFTISNAT
ncbi:hypothetical protein H9Q72_009383 [Fusarium xylarioides]|uniref:Uncharacterized protein n=1 Tax=Fusarium xylarioides TaxID=221167 RepID=A0A9P7L383_9HYPO|nr:hypothetical protein H9Q70_011893 [Fusarium xylarioides]KAG5762521.1 hypothetical protein H9Q72_009383 [Fusarium xylarioides]KAG5805331.1 hypothetical protein H9Q71_010088 [Fusarium xylarioides]KAG5819526.1 hypothetical protein H9Q74_009420 [Fusarium xylarioides]